MRVKANQILAGYGHSYRLCHAKRNSTIALTLLVLIMIFTILNDVLPVGRFTNAQRVLFGVGYGSIM